MNALSDVEQSDGVPTSLEDTDKRSCAEEELFENKEKSLPLQPSRTYPFPFIILPFDSRVRELFVVQIIYMLLVEH